MVYYKIGSCGWSYSVFTDTIDIGGILDSDKLSENERDIYISDVITHEYMHRLMHKYFNNTVSSLFDTIERHFRNMSILEKLVASTYHNTHTTYIKENGIDEYLKNAGIDAELFNKAKELCNMSERKTNTKGI